MEGPNSEEAITVACIVDCPTITANAGKHYKALIDSGAVISLIQYSNINILIIVSRLQFSLQQQN